MYRVLICVALLQCVCAFTVQREEVIDIHKYFSYPRERNAGTSPRIIGGDVVQPHSYPFQAALLIYKDSDIYFCGGSLLSENLVLTAAHCVDMLPDSIIVGLGIHDLFIVEPESVILNSTNYTAHSNWSSETLQNDIALVRLPQNVTFNQYIQPVQIAVGSDKYEDESATLIGWGQTKNESLSSLLRSVNSTILSNTDCANVDPVYEQVIVPSHICTSGVGPVGSCSGDSGGPLIVDGVLVGITSFGTTNCSLGYPSVFTRVTEFFEWIVENGTN